MMRRRIDPGKTGDKILGKEIHRRSQPVPGLFEHYYPLEACALRNPNDLRQTPLYEMAPLEDAQDGRVKNMAFQNPFLTQKANSVDLKEGMIAELASPNIMIEQKDNYLFVLRNFFNLGEIHPPFHGHYELIPVQGGQPELLRALWGQRPTEEHEEYGVEEYFYGLGGGTEDSDSD